MRNEGWTLTCYRCDVIFKSVYLQYIVSLERCDDDYTRQTQSMWSHYEIELNYKEIVLIFFKSIILLFNLIN